MKNFTEQERTLITEIENSYDPQIARAAKEIRGFTELSTCRIALEVAFGQRFKSDLFAGMIGECKDDEITAYDVLMKFLYELEKIEALIEKERELKGVPIPQ